MKEKSKFHTNSTKIVHYASHNSRARLLLNTKQKKTAFLRKKVVISFPLVLRLELDGKKIARDTSEQPQMFYKRKNEPRVNSTWSELFEN